MNNSIEIQGEAGKAGGVDLLGKLDQLLKEGQGEETGEKRRGRPRQVAWIQICLGLLVSVLYGMNNYQQLWRRLTEGGLPG